jgi:hypothetical protein
MNPILLSQQQKIDHADQGIGHQSEIACDQSGNRHVTSCLELTIHVSRARAVFVENKDQNIQVQCCPCY